MEGFARVEFWNGAASRPRAPKTTSRARSARTWSVPRLSLKFQVRAGGDPIDPGRLRQDPRCLRVNPISERRIRGIGGRFDRFLRERRRRGQTVVERGQERLEDARRPLHKQITVKANTDVHPAAIWRRQPRPGQRDRLRVRVRWAEEGCDHCCRGRSFTIPTTSMYLPLYVKVCKINRIKE